jgi:DNA-binding CsgD family transcriptional regulator
MKPTNEWKLSPREVQCIELSAEVGMAKLVADKLGISLSTVESYRQSATKKAGARSFLPVVVAWDRNRRTNKGEPA